MRNLLFGADFLQNHIRHFYLLGLPDYVKGPNVHPFVPGYTGDYRLPKKVNDEMVQHYFEAVEISRLAHEMVALLGAKAPHQHGVVAGGSSVGPDADIVLDFGAKLERVRHFVEEKMVPDVYKLAESYSDYYQIGVRPANLLEYGLFLQDGEDRQRYFPGGVVLEGKMEDLDSGLINEHIKFSWYAGSGEPQHPEQGETVPDREKADAYSWVKAPRYRGRPMEGGPLARLWIKGIYRNGVSIMDRIVARVLEARGIAKAMTQWLEQLEPEKTIYQEYQVPREGQGSGLTGAMRGPLGHWVRIEKGRIAHYQIITPTAWNFSPRDNQDQKGPVEEALTGIPIDNEKEPIEVGRVVRSFDVCFSCSTHVMVVGQKQGQMWITI